MVNNVNYIVIGNRPCYDSLGTIRKGVRTMAIKSSQVEQAGARNKYYRATGFTSIKAFFGNYVNFKGRSSRSEYWWISLFQTILSIIVLIAFLGAVVGAIAGSSQGIDPKKLFASLGAGLVIFLVLVVVFYVAVILPSIGLTVRRYRDGGIPWWIFPIQLIVYGGAQLLKSGSTAQSLVEWAALLSMIILALLPSKPLPVSHDGFTQDDGLDSRIDPSVFANKDDN